MLVLALKFQGGTTPFYFAPTRNCTTCCGNGQDGRHTHTVTVTDFDLSADGGKTFSNATHAVIGADGMTVKLQTSARTGPVVVRYVNHKL